MQIEGSKAIMVGGASGMCLATAEKFVEKGGQVAILDLEKSDGAAVAERLGWQVPPLQRDGPRGHRGRDGRGGGSTSGACSSASTRPAAARRSARSARTARCIPLDVFQKVIDLNLIASFNINRIAASHMAKNDPNEEGERGVMINTASIAAFEGQVGQVVLHGREGGHRRHDADHGAGPRRRRHPRA
jgi:NAD(P)-dependent dehydrogenase (short-subunit alcohol dehydrogenase family)